MKPKNREKPLLNYKDSSEPKCTPKLQASIFEVFMDLSPTNKEKYLNLSLKEFPCAANILDQHQRKIHNIYETNTFQNGVFLKMSRFNHACIPNAEYFWNEETKFRDLRAIRPIKIGEEITLSYIGVSCQDRDERRTHLKNYFQFHCTCDACEISEEKAEKEREICSKYKALKRECSNLIGRAEVNNLKEMYKLAKDMRTLRIGEILNSIVEIGFDSACQGFLNSRDPSAKQEFKQDVHSFTKVGVLLSKRLYGESHSEVKNWIDKENNDIKYFMREENIHQIHKT